MFAKNFQLACGYPQRLGFDPEMFWKCWDQTWGHDGIMFRKVRKRVENPKQLTPTNLSKVTHHRFFISFFVLFSSFTLWNCTFGA
jgi:hypothetical protein